MTLGNVQNQFAQQAALVHPIYLALFGACTWLWLRRGGVETTPIVTLICLLPAIIGVVLARTSTADYDQYLSRMAAAALFTPILLVFWSTSQEPAAGVAPRAVWPFGVAACLVHAAAFVGLIYWLGTKGTMVPAEEGTAPVTAQVLSARLLSLNSISGPFDIANSAKPDEVEAWFRYRPDEERSLVVTIHFDEGNHVAHVQERTNANGARPKDEAERSMRGPGDPFFDPARPTADRVYGKTWQTSIIDRARLGATEATLRDRSVVVPASFAAKLDETGMVTLFCAVVTRSGWTWQPEFIASK